MRVVSRKLPLPTVENCRDLGGIHTEQGRMVRPGLLVRSANLHDARHDDLETLAHRGISNVIDLRTDPERDLKPDRLLEDWSFYALPTFRETKALRLQLRDIVTRPGTFIEDLYPRLVLDKAPQELAGVEMPDIAYMHYNLAAPDSLSANGNQVAWIKGFYKKDAQGAEYLVNRRHHTGRQDHQVTPKKA